MKDVFPLPNIPGYVNIKEAARILGVAESSVYRYVQSGRLPGYQAGHNIMVEEKALQEFKPTNAGRPREKDALWRVPPADNALQHTSIHVQVKAGKLAEFRQRLDEIRRKKAHLFPGTIARYVLGDSQVPEQVEIVLIWRLSVMPDETTREQALEAFKQALIDVVDWETARFSDGIVYMHA